MDYYLILEVHYLASNDVIKAAYRRLSQKYHPDMGGGDADFLKIQKAYHTLIDPSLREAYMAVWLNHHMPQPSFEKSDLDDQIYDVSLRPVINVLVNYLNAIKDQDYNTAYEMLSIQNRKKLFLKDYVAWQTLISEIHLLLDFECRIEKMIPFDQTSFTSIILKVKVKEFNTLLNRTEEEYFLRTVIFENNKWRILLNDIDVKTVIRKYKKILLVNKKNTKVLKHHLPKIEENHFTKLVSKKYFINNSEYELLRFKRYKNPFTIVTFYSKNKHLIASLESIIASKTRILDSFCKYTSFQFYLLLPESNEIQGEIVIKKILSQFRVEEKNNIKVYKIEANDEDKSIKEMLRKLRGKIDENE